MEARHSSHKLLPGCQRLRSKVCGQGECTAPITRCAALLQMLMQLEGRAILWTYLKMGLRGQKGLRLDARVCYQKPHLFSTSPTCQEPGSTLSACQTKLWGKDSACLGSGHNPSLDKAGKKFIQEVCGVSLFLAC